MNELKAVIDGRSGTREMTIPCDSNDTIQAFGDLVASASGDDIQVRIFNGTHLVYDSEARVRE